MAIHITSDNFVWLDVTKKLTHRLSAFNYHDELFAAFELYEVDEEGRDRLIEEPELIPRAIERGSRICIEVGNLPQAKHQEDWWENANKKVIDGFVYVRWADVKISAK